MQTVQKVSAAEVIDWVEAIAAIKEPEDRLPPIRKARHPFEHLDFYFIMMALTCAMATTTSMIDQWMLEPLIFGCIANLILALIFNLTRDRQQVTIFRRIHRGPLFELPKPIVKTLRDLQRDHGIKLVGPVAD